MEDEDLWSPHTASIVTPAKETQMLKVTPEKKRKAENGREIEPVPKKKQKTQATPKKEATKGTNDELHANLPTRIIDAIAAHKAACSTLNCEACGRLDWFASTAQSCKMYAGGGQSVAAGEEIWADLKLGEDDKVFVGCLACNKTGSTVQGGKHHFGRYKVDLKQLKPWQLTRHAKQDGHKTAVAEYLTKETCNNGTPFNAAPSSSTFRKVLNALNKGHRPSSRKGIDGVGNRSVVLKLFQLLSKAKRKMVQDYLERAHAIALIRDERAYRLLVRYRAIFWKDKKLIIKSGVLGQAKLENYSSSAQSIADATHSVVSTIASTGREKKNVAEATKKYMHKVEALTVDSASAELLSGEIMRGTDGSSNPDPMAPNQKLVIRDATHAARRSQQILFGISLL